MIVKSESSNEGWVTLWSVKLKYLKSFGRVSQGFSFVRKVGGDRTLSETQIALMFL